MRGYRVVKTYNFSNIKFQELQEIFNVKKSIDESVFDTWFNFDYDSEKVR